MASSATRFMAALGAGSNTRVFSKGLGASRVQRRGVTISLNVCRLRRGLSAPRSLAMVGMNSRRNRNESGTRGTT